MTQGAGVIERAGRRSALTRLDVAVLLAVVLGLIATLPLTILALERGIRYSIGEHSPMSYIEELAYRADLAIEYGDAGVVINAPLNPDTYAAVLEDAIAEYDPEGLATWKSAAHYPGDRDPATFRAMFVIEQETVYINEARTSVVEITGTVAHEMSHVRWNERVKAGIEDAEHLNRVYDTFGNLAYEMHADCEAASVAVVSHYWDCPGGTHPLQASGDE